MNKNLVSLVLVASAILLIALVFILNYLSSSFSGTHSSPSPPSASSTTSSEAANSSRSTKVREYRIHVTALEGSVELHAFDSEGRHTGPFPNPIPGSDLVTYDKEIINSSYLHPNDIALNVEEGPYQVKINFLSTSTITLTVTETLSDFDRGLLDREVDKWEFPNLKGESGCVLLFSLGKTLKDSTQPQLQCPN